MTRSAISVAVLFLAAACGQERNAPVVKSQVPMFAEQIETSPETFALGTAVTPEGAIPEIATGETFLRGSEVWLSVDVKSASTNQTIAVEWIGPQGRPIRKDEKEIPQSAQYAAFSTGPTRRWTAGTYVAVVVIDGRRVTERPFVLS